MNVFAITVVIQFFLAILCFIRFLKIYKQKETILYCHERKSFLDTYGGVAKCTIFSIIIVCAALLVKMMCENQLVVLKSYEVFVIVWLGIVVTMVLILVMALSLYMVTEIKHLSFDDAIGKKIRNLESNEKKKAYMFYKEEFFIGLSMIVTLQIQAFYLHLVIGGVLFLTTIFLYCFGMADVLQHDNYNAAEYKTDYKRKSLLERMYIKNVIRFSRDTDYRRTAIKVLKDNTKNIKKGAQFLIAKREY